MKEQLIILNKIFRIVTPWTIVFVSLIVLSIWIVFIGNSRAAPGAFFWGIFLFMCFTPCYIAYIALRKTILRKTPAGKLWLFEAILLIILYMILYS